MNVAFGSDEHTALTDAVCADLETRGHAVVRVDDGELGRGRSRGRRVGCG